MKLCASPADTRCMYQRIIARDQASDDPDDGAQADPDVVQRAYADLYERLASTDDTEALGLLKHLMNAMTGGGAMDDEPMPAPPGGAMDRQIRAGKRIAREFMFDQKFPNAARIRSIG